MMLRTIFFLTLILDVAQGWILDVSHQAVAKKLTANVTVNCIYDGFNNGISPLSVISRIRISKFRDNGSWQTIARLFAINNDLSTTLTDAQVTGNVDKLANTFLKISFDVASNESIGNFKCDVDGYDVNGDVTVVSTLPVTISSRGVSYDDILAVLLKLQQQEHVDHATDLFRIGLVRKTLQVMEPRDKSSTGRLNSLLSQISTLSRSFLKVTDNLLKQQTQIEAEIKEIQDARKKQASWPEGVYTIMKSVSGCPFSSEFNWQETSVAIRTQGVTNTSDSNHLMDPNRVTPTAFMHSCSKVTTVSGPAWPKGKYCIQAYASATTTRCPVNFDYGQVTFDRFNAPGNDVIVNLPNVKVTNDLTTLGYCCRQDGATSHTINLPTQDPFYLYRFGGVCQEVVGMNVTNEWMSMDTLSKDSYSNTFHPDGQIKGVKLELCYYTPT